MQEFTAIYQSGNLLVKTGRGGAPNRTVPMLEQVIFTATDREDAAAQVSEHGKAHNYILVEITDTSGEKNNHGYIRRR